MHGVVEWWVDRSFVHVLERVRRWRRELRGVRVLCHNLYAILELVML
jgi:Cys-tRNA synthase (O-phospho-L-seryl-tRNA:Cys-tRNA synthase)